MYLLDTTACMRVLNGTSQTLLGRLRAHDPAEIRLCSVVKAELLFGARRSKKVEPNLLLLERFFGPFMSVPFDNVAAAHYGAIRAELTRAGAVLGPNDLMIAATARANDLVLVTRNEREFSRVIGLRTENWE